MKNFNLTFSYADFIVVGASTKKYLPHIVPQNTIRTER